MDRSDQWVREGIVDEFMDRRLKHEAARKYTVIHEGVEKNAGLFRDNMADVLEELSDAANITGICLDRVLGESGTSKHGVLRLLLDLRASIIEAAKMALEVRDNLPSEMTEDISEVLGDKTPDRIVYLSDIEWESRG